MEREQFKVLVKAMKAVYAQPTFIPDQDAFNVWFALLGDLPYKQAELAVQKHMATEKFPPTIADIREKAEQITSVKETEMSESWKPGRLCEKQSEDQIIMQKRNLRNCQKPARWQ